MPIAVREQILVMDGNTAFAAAPVNGAAGAPALFYTTPLTAKGMILQVDIQDGTTFSLTFTIKAWNPYADTPVETETILASAARTTNAGFMLIVYPGQVAVSNVAISYAMPQYWSLVISGTTDTAKAKVVAQYIP